MAVMAILVFGLINDSQQGKASARLNGVASTAVSVYRQASRSANHDARTAAQVLEARPRRVVDAGLGALAHRIGAARIVVTDTGMAPADYGDPTAVAPGMAIVHQVGSSRKLAVTVWAVSASDYANQISGHGSAAIVQRDGRVLGSTVPAKEVRTVPQSGEVHLNGATYRTDTLRFHGYALSPVAVTVLSDTASTGGSASTWRILAALFIALFLALAVGFTLLMSRALQGQLDRFLQAARRLGAGDFSSRIETHGNDEFAALGAEFNSMSDQLARRLEDLKHEQARVRRSIRHIGDAFAANLDRTGLLELALETAIDATAADRGRITARGEAGEPLVEVAHSGQLEGLAAPIRESERLALSSEGLGQAAADDFSIATVALGPITPGGPTHGLITVARENRRFGEDDLELLRSLASRATLALANVNLHFDVKRQAITDDLTGLATHGHFQQLLAAELDGARRYGYPVGLVMIDLDDFKSINDLHGHQQGDVVLRYVAGAVRENSRDVDVAARYGGEELALILPHTDLEGAYVIAERTREAIEQLRIPVPDAAAMTQITASVGVAASAETGKDELITAADNALYAAKREGKNRTVKASEQTANVLGGR
jgi:diguanylate cyclase (GGDEF)-like protein